MLMEKQDMQHLKLKMPLLRKKSPSTTVTFDHISRKKNGFQPDFILEYAHYLHEYYQQQGFNNPEVYVESYTERKIKPKYIDPKRT
jgi:hypothetical protein